MERHTSFRGLAGKFVLTVVVLLVPLQYTFAREAGIAGYSGATRDCTSCHTAGAAVPTVTLAGSATVTAGTVNTYTLSISGGPGGSASLDVSATGGTLVATMAGTKLLSGEVVQSAPIAFANGQAAISFDWQAPANNGTYTLYAAGLSADNPANAPGGDTGDGTATATLAITVTGGGTAPQPEPPPGPTGPGADLYAANCEACHGPGGVGGPDGDVIGESAEDIAEAIAEVDVMDFLAGMSEEDIAAIADYLNPVADGPGADLYAANCEECHGAGGVGGPDGDVVGADAEDIAEAIEEEDEMNFLADVLSEDDIQAIADYLAMGSDEDDDEEGDEEDITAFDDGRNSSDTKSRRSARSQNAASTTATASLDIIALFGLAGALAAMRRRK